MEEKAAEKLKNKYVLMRNSNREIEEEGEKRLSIPITVRQLEAIVRISESLAKMELKPFATDAHVDEAIRIFQVESSLQFFLNDFTYFIIFPGVNIICSPIW